MDIFVDMPDAAIIHINTIINGGIKCVINPSTVGSYKSSIDYIDEFTGKIASAVVSTARNHSFKDGNKRTALSMYALMCFYNGLEPIEDAEHIILKIVVDRLEWQDAAPLLFPKQ